MAINIRNLPKEDIKKVINDYKNGKSMRQIEKDYQITRQSVATYLEDIGVKTTKGNHYRKYTHQYDFFKNIDNEVKAYWLGFMFADGYIVDYSKRYGEDHFGMTLHGKDVNMLERFKQDIKATNPIIDVSRENRYLKRLVMVSQETVDDLISHGCFKQKSLILEPPKDIPENLIHHFIRGFFDGDGSIFYNKSAFEAHETWLTPSFSINITSTKAMVEWLIEILGFGNIHKEERREKTWYYCQSGNYKVKSFCDFIYKDATVYMPRKYELYQKLLQISGN